MTSDKGQAGAATLSPKQNTRTRTEVPAPRLLPPFKVILHNDDKNELMDVVETIIMLTPLGKEAAVDRTLEAHQSGCALLLVTHQERAELYAEQFKTRNLTVTIEPDE